MIRPLLTALLIVPAPMARELESRPEEQVAAIVEAFMVRPSTDWDGLGSLPGIRWAPLPPQSLKECLPDGGCYTRVGQASVEGRTLNLMATGARTIVSSLYIRNAGTPIGGDAVLTALQARGVASTLARCPMKGGAGVTSWYRLTGPGEPAVLAIQPARTGKPNEGYVVSAGAELPQLQPNQLAQYSEECAAGATAAQKPVSSTKPHIALADVVTVMLVPGTATGVTWTELRSLDTGIEWNGDPKKWDLSYKNDPNPIGLSGSVTWAGRKFSVLASGTPQQAKVVYLEEMGMHPKGEHMLGVVYERGIAVKLVRCGPVYTESTNNWYSLTSGKTRPAMIQQSIRYEGSQVQDAYALRLDGTLPQRESRDRDPGVAGCR